MRTYKGVENLGTIITNQAYQLRVRTGNSTMDSLTYEFALIEFGKYLPISEKEPYTGTIEIIFTSTSQSSFVGSSTAFTTGSGYADMWYTGSGYIGVTGGGAAVGTSISSGSTFTWQNSTMFVWIKNLEGKRLWTADYNYKGGMEMSGFWVNTADEAARLCIKRLVNRFENEFPNK